MKLTFLLVVIGLAASLSCGGGSGQTTPPGTATWERVSTPFSQPAFIDFGSNGHWFAADRIHGFYRSTDGGSTWTAINSGLATNFGWTITALPGGNLIAAIYSLGGPNQQPVSFYRSSNEGSSWSHIQSGRLDTYPAWTGCAVASNSNVVCGGYWAASPATGGWYSSNTGQSVTAASATSTNGTSVFALAANPVNHDLWMGTEQYGIFRSTNNGATWSPASPPDQNIDPAHGIRDGNVYAITFDRNGNVVFGAQGGIWKSSSSGSGFTWTNVKVNNNTADGYGLARDASGTLYYGHKLDSNDPTSLYCSTDDGSTWHACDNGLPQAQEIVRMVVNPSDRKLYAVVWNPSGDSGAIYRTSKPVQ